MLKNFLLALGTLTLVAGCAAPQVPLTRDVQAGIDPVESVLVVPKSALGVSVDPTNIGGGLLDQLLAAYIDSKREAKAAVTADPILSKVQDYDFRAALRDAWNTEAAQSTRTKFVAPVQIESLKADEPATLERKMAILDASSAAAVMFSAIDYSLRGSTLMVSAQVEIFPKAVPLLRFRHAPSAGGLLDEGNVIYRQNFALEREFVTPANVRKNLDDAAAGIVRKIIADLNAPR